MKRRDFLKTGSLAAGFAVSGKLPLFGKSSGSVQPTSPNKPGDIPKRPYGPKGPKLSVIGFGGIIVMNEEQDTADRMVAEAYQRGVNYFDVAPTYGDAEIKLGPALEPYRKEVFLSCKTVQRKYDAGKAEFERSLERMRTDYFDLYQMHAVSEIEKDVDAAFADDGVMKLLREEKKNGRIRYLGFSAHSPQAALEALNRYPFDSVMFPVNFAEYLKGDFSPEVLDYCQKNGVAVIALKMFARQRAPQDDPVRRHYPKCWYQPITERQEAIMAASFTLSRPITTALPPGDERLFKLALEVLPQIKPVTDADIEQLRHLADDLDPIFKRDA